MTLIDIENDVSVESTWVIYFHPGVLDQEHRLDNQRNLGVVDTAIVVSYDSMREIFTPLLYGNSNVMPSRISKVVVLLKMGLQTEDADGIISYIIFGSTDDLYHIPILYYGPFNSNFIKSVCLLCNTRHFRNGSALKLPMNLIRTGANNFYAPVSKTMGIWFSL